MKDFKFSEYLKSNILLEEATNSKNIDLNFRNVGPKVTAVEWFNDSIIKELTINGTDLKTIEIIERYQNKATEIEKAQQMQAYLQGGKDNANNKKQAEDYYNNRFMY